MKELFKNLKFCWKYAKKEKSKLIGYIICNLVDIFINIFVPIMSAKIIVSLTSNKFIQVISIALVILLIEILRNIIIYISRYFTDNIYKHTFTEVQKSIGSEILKLENKAIDSNSSGVFIERLTNDTGRIANIFTDLNIYIRNIIIDIGIFIAIFVINKIVGLYLLIVFIILIVVEKRGTDLYNKRDKVVRKKREKASGFVGELVRGCKDIKMLNAEESFIKELNSKVIDLNEEQYKMNKVDRFYQIIIGTFLDLSDFLMIALLVCLIMSNKLEIAEALVIHNYMGRVTSSIGYIDMLFQKIKDFNLSTSRIFELISSTKFPKEKFGMKHLDKVDGNFEFKNVSFSYEEENIVLKNINFNVKKDETVAFVGKSGAGKSTIFSLLCKMYDTYEGVITIDGVDIKELDRDSIRGNITVISQNPYIFNLSIRDNLRLVKEDATDKEIKEACHLACLDDFIESLPNKYNTIIGEGGVNLSGGQRQRLAIARALVQKTEIILFDEATSALDNETQNKISLAIDNMKKDYTILIIAHRLSTVINSDRILFLNNGKIEAEGTHNELLKKNKDYKKLYELELKEKN